MGVDTPRGRDDASSPLAPALLFRLRATARESAAGLASLVVLVALLGGVSMAAIAGARRTSSSLPQFLTSTRASDLDIASGSVGDVTTPYSANTAKALERLPGVAQVATAVFPSTILPLDASGHIDTSAPPNIAPTASYDGLYFDVDRLTLVSGRLADPADPRQLVVTSDAEAQLHWSIGEVVPIGIYRFKDLFQGDPTRATPTAVLHVRVVGIVRQNTTVLEDDAQHTSGVIIFTPAFGHLVAQDAWQTTYALRVRDPARNVPAIERAFPSLIPPGSSYRFRVASHDEARVQRAIGPEAAALALFGAIAGAVAIVVCGLALGRQIRAGAADRRILRDLGASPLLSAADGLPLLLVAIVAGAVFAALVAIVASPLAPIGAVRAFESSARISLDWTVLGLGTAGLAVVLTCIALAVTWRLAPWGRPTAKDGARRPSRLLGLVTRSGVPRPLVVGTWFALGRGGRRSTTPVRSVVIGCVVGVATMAATLTFAAGLGHLVSTPRLYGWNWDVALFNGNGVVPQADAARLHDDSAVASFWDVSFGNISLNGQNVPAVLSDAPSALGPTMLSGHHVTNPHEIVLGPTTLAELHLQVGAPVTLSYGTPGLEDTYVPPTTLRIVGTADFPAVGSTGTFNADTSMGTGAWVPRALEPPGFRPTGGDPLENGWDIVFVKFKPGVTAKAGRSSLMPLVDSVDTAFAHDDRLRGDVLSVLDTLRPAEIVDYRTIGATPVVFACALAVGAGVALALSLIASVRRRRHDIALLKTLGFDTQQIAIAVVWHSLVIALAGTLLGVPLGVVAGRQLWILFAHTIAVPPVTVLPVTAIALVILGTLIFAVLVSLVPGRSAARTPAASNLRSE